MSENNNQKSTVQKIGIGVAIGAVVGGLGIIGYEAFQASQESLVCYYGPAPIIEEQEEPEGESKITFDPKMEEVMCDYGVPTTFWDK